MTPSHAFDRRGIAPLLVALEAIRPDVKQALGPAFESAANADIIRSWFEGSGAVEEGVEVLYQKFGGLLDRRGASERAVECWKKRPDLQRAFPEAFSKLGDVRAYAQWIEVHGISEHDFAVGDGKQFLADRFGLVRPLMLFLQDINLQREFVFPFIEDDRDRLVAWFYREAIPRGILAPGDVAWFEGFATTGADLLASIVLGHGAWLHANLVGGGTVFDMRQVSDMLAERGRPASSRLLRALYLHPIGMDVSCQAEQFALHNDSLKPLLGDMATGSAADTFVAKLLSAMTTNVRASDGAETFGRSQPARAAEARGAGLASGVLSLFRTSRAPSAEVASVAAQGAWTVAEPAKLIRERLQQGILASTKVTGVNVAGYFLAPTGMGESARSMVRTFARTPLAAQEVPLFSTQYRLGEGDLGDEVAACLAPYDTRFQTNIFIANGDEWRHLRDRLPRSMIAGRKNIGYWVWETERLPADHADTEGLTEIWTPSTYSADAIRQVVKIPVHVLPHALDFAQIDASVPLSSAFGVPSDGLLFGYFFDCKSIVERKNPFGLLKAFRDAFGVATDDGPTLLLKLSSPEAAPNIVANLQKAAAGLKVVWLMDELSRADTLALMRRVDVYASLHRAEGFGLTMAEAMAMGKPVVGSGYSGNLEFMSADNSLLVPTVPFTTDTAHGPYPAGTRWGAPDLAVASRMFRELTDAGRRAALGLRAAESIRARLSPEVVGKSLLALLGH